MNDGLNGGEVYCPSCSSHNQDEVKFCTRCGTNLGVVSDALSGKLSSRSPIDERLITVFKDFYRGRNSVIIGSIASAIALFKVVLFGLLGIPTKPDFLGVAAAMLLAYGLFALIWGAAKWNNAASQIKAIERAASQGASPSSEEKGPAMLSAAPAGIRTGVHSTDPIEVPASVTEQTTRQLDQRAYTPPPKASE